MPEFVAELQQKSPTKRRKVGSDEKPIHLGLEENQDLKNPQTSFLKSPRNVPKPNDAQLSPQFSEQPLFMVTKAKSVKFMIEGPANGLTSPGPIFNQIK